jgi:Tfp pilus assembly protein PilZ
MRLLLARYRNGAEFLERYQADFEHGGLFFPTRRALEPGEPVLVDVRLSDLRDDVLMRGVVAGRQRGKRIERQRAGLLIEFLASEAAKRDHLLRIVRGEVTGPEAQRRHRRLPIEVPVDWRVPNTAERHASLAEDIGTGGAFLRTQTFPEMGTPVVLELRPPGGSAAQSIEGRVAWISHAPGHEGVGIEFRCRDIGGMRRLRELVRRIERQELVS